MKKKKRFSVEKKGKYVFVPSPKPPPSLPHSVPMEDPYVFIDLVLARCVYTNGPVGLEQTHNFDPSFLFE